MQNSSKPLFNRSDTFFGVCEGLGQELGINPNWLRVVVALALLANIKFTIAAYVTLGIVVYLARWLMPDRATVADAVQDAHADVAGNDAEPVSTAIAA